MGQCRRKDQKGVFASSGFDQSACWETAIHMPRVHCCATSVATTDIFSGVSCLFG